VSVDAARIGVGANGTTPVPNAGTGVAIDGTSGDDPNGSSFIDSIVAHNHIGFLVQGGVRRTLIRVNSIFDNADGGIDDHTGEVPIAPELRDAHKVHKYGISVEYKVSVPGFDSGELDFYSTPSCEKGGAGKKWLGRADVKVSETHTVGLLGSLAVGTGITATLTTRRRGTSEFSKCIELKPKPKI
jgi:hypothetical protein